MFGGLRPVFKRFHDDFSKHTQSVKVLLDYEWDVAIPSHMKPVKIPREKIEKYLEKRSK